MEKEFVPYELAVKLKELGFYESCFGVFQTQEKGQLIIQYFEKSSLKFATHLLPAPTFSQAFRWFREKYNLLGCPQYFTGGYYCYTINDMKGTEESNRLFTEFSSYEEAELACLKKLIEIVEL